MIIRYIKKEDQEEFCKTSSAAFIWEMSDDDLKDYPEEQVLAAFCDDNKTIMAQIEVLPFKNIFCGKHLLSSGIGGVASRPEYRRQGAVRKLFLEYFDQAVAEGQVLSGLYPFSTNYYRQFGYEPVTKCISVLAPFSELAKIPRNCNAELFEGSRKQLNKLLGIYNAYAENYNLMFQRTTDKYFSKEPYKKNLYTYMWNDGKGKARSYATFSISRPESTLTVNEIIFTDKESLLGILGFLRVYDGNIEKISFSKLTPSSQVLSIIDEYSKFKVTMGRGAAMRIINVEEILKANAYPEEQGRFSLKINDTQIKQNNHIFEVEYNKGDFSIKKRKSGAFDLCLTPTAASRLLLGGEGLTADMIGYINGAEINKKDISGFLKAFPARFTDMYDGF